MAGATEGESLDIAATPQQAREILDGATGSRESVALGAVSGLFAAAYAIAFSSVPVGVVLGITLVYECAALYFVRHLDADAQRRTAAFRSPGGDLSSQVPEESSESRAARHRFRRFAVIGYGLVAAVLPSVLWL